MKKEIAEKLKSLGFPEITRIAMENNLHRYSSMDADPVTFPFLQELIQEIDRLCPRRWLLARTENYDGAFMAVNGSPEGAWYEQAHADTPEDALALLWIKLKTS